MGYIWNEITKWLKDLLVSGIMSNLTGLFSSVNAQVADIADTVGMTPQGWNASVFNMVRSLSDTVVVPIAGVILAIVMTMELIQMLIDRNNMHDFDTFMIYKWIFKTFVSVTIVTNTWNIVMAVFDVSQSIVNDASGIIVGSTTLDFDTLIPDLQSRLEALELGELDAIKIDNMREEFRERQAKKEAEAFNQFDTKKMFGGVALSKPEAPKPAPKLEEVPSSNHIKITNNDIPPFLRKLRGK